MITKGRDPREVAEAMMSRSICSVQVGACLADKHNIFSWGWNGVGGSERYGMHAEVHCLLRANKRRFKGATLYVASQRNRHGKMVTSKPCWECEAMIRWSGIKETWWRGGDGNWRKL